MQTEPQPGQPQSGQPHSSNKMVGGVLVPTLAGNIDDTSQNLFSGAAFSGVSDVHEVITWLLAHDTPLHTIAFPRAFADAVYFAGRMAPVLAPFGVSADRIIDAHRRLAADKHAPVSAIGEQGIDAFLSPISLAAPDHVVLSAWLEHAPFAFWLIEALRPHSFVELGTHNGYSYFAICQAVKALGLDTRCHAIDTWKGDDHSGFYGEDVYEDVRHRNETEYGNFSTLIRQTFDDSVDAFEDGSIDLLHIDGRHYYEDVKHDFETWRRKLSARSVVLFHDTKVQKPDFGVGQFWEELRTEFPSFEFHHGHGLGVLGFGAHLPAAVRRFFTVAAQPSTAETIRKTYENLGSRPSMQLSFDQERKELAETAAVTKERMDRLAADLEKRHRENGALREALNDASATASKLEDAKAEVARLSTQTDALTERLEDTKRKTAVQNRLLEDRTAELRTLKFHLGSVERTAENRVNEAVARADQQAVLLAQIHASSSWRITAPLRWSTDRARWLARNGRRSAKLLYWLGTGQFRRAKTASEPYRRKAKAFAGSLFGKSAQSNSTAQESAGNNATPNHEADHPDTAYAEWIERNDTLSDDDRNLIREHIRALENQPTFSIIMPVFDPPPAFLREALESVRAQLYENWELCIADDASPSPETREILEEYAELDSRIRISRREKNGGISACSNTALEMATGEWMVLMDHDDLIAEHALYLVAEAINRHPRAAILYSDEDRLDDKGRRVGPFFKPDWDHDLFLGQNLISHLGVYRADLVRRVGGFREGYEGSQDWDFALRVLDAEAEPNVIHIPFILYHWRLLETSFSETSLARAADSARRAVTEHLARTNQAASVVLEGHSSHLCIKREIPAPCPSVSVVIPTRDHADLLRACIDGLVNRTEYEPMEIVVIDNGSVEPEALAFLAEIETWKCVKLLRDPRPFNYSRLINQGIAEASGEVCVLLNNDIDMLRHDWLTELVSHAVRPNVGAVGAKLYYPDDTLQHGGVILGLGGFAGHAHRHAPRSWPGYVNRLNLTHNLSSVTGACLAARRSVFDEVGGLNETELTVAYNDVDFCLRLKRAGYQIIWTPHAELYHFESISRGHDTTPEKVARSEEEQDYMRRTWGPFLDRDPYFNPNLSLSSTDFVPDLGSRVSKPWRAIASDPTAKQISHDPITNAVQDDRAEPLSPQISRSPIDLSEKHESPALSRRDKLVLGLNLSTGRGLEIGPSHNPIAPKRDGHHVEILDHADAAALKAKYAAHNVQIEKIEEVDYVWQGEPLDELIGKRSWYDWIIASHVIEHTPDFVSFLQQCRRMLKPEGIISLAVPDHRFCFDHFRPVSTPGEFLLAHLERRTRHTSATMWDMASLATTSNGRIAWPGASGDDFEMMRGPDEAKSLFEAMLQSEEYVDLHNWRFTPASFQLAVADMRRLGHLELAVERIFPTEGHEFFAQLRVAELGEPDDVDRFELVMQMKSEATCR